MHINFSARAIMHSALGYTIRHHRGRGVAAAAAAAYVRIMQELLAIFRRFASDAARDSSARASARKQIRRSRFPRFPLDARRRAESAERNGPRAVRAVVCALSARSAP